MWHVQKWQEVPYIGMRSWKVRLEPLANRHPKTFGLIHEAKVSPQRSLKRNTRESLRENSRKYVRDLS